MSTHNSFLSVNELENLGLKSCGVGVLISRKASLYGVSNIEIGDNVRIDDFCVLSGNIHLASNIHIAAFCALYGGDSLITIGDFSGLSARTTIYAISDDFSGNYMVGAMVDDEYRNVIKGTVDIKKYVQVGAGCVVLPGVTIAEGVSLGAMSLVNKSLEEWTIYAGIPSKALKKRSKELLKFSKKLLNE